MEQDTPDDHLLEETKPIIDEPKPSGYKVVSVYLLASSFTRTNDINLDDTSKISHNIDITPGAHETAPSHHFAVTLKLLYKGLQDQDEICSADITMMGVFEKYGEPILSDEKFKSVNAPAILYPFIREHLHNLCLKAGIVNILLPTINFKP